MMRRPFEEARKTMTDVESGTLDFERVALDLIAGVAVPRDRARAFWNEAPEELRQRVVADMLALDARYLGHRPTAH